MAISKFKLFTYQNRLPHFGMVKLRIEQLATAGELEIVEAYNGAGFVTEGEPEILSAAGYANWKEGIRRGIRYAIGKLEDPQGLRVTIIKAVGDANETNPTILGFVASRAVLKDRPHQELNLDRKKLHQLVFTSWLYGFEGMPNFEKMAMEGSQTQPQKIVLPSKTWKDAISEFFKRIFPFFFRNK